MAANNLPDSTQWPVLGTAGRNEYRVSDQWVDLRRPERAAKAISLRAEPQSLILDLQRAALLVIDMQNDFCHPEGWLGAAGVDVDYGRRLIDPINRVSAALRNREVPVIWLNWGVRPDRLNLSPGTCHPFNPRGSGPGLAGAMTAGSRDHTVLQFGSWGAQVIDELVRSPGDIDVAKHRISGLWDTPLDSILRNLRVSTLLFAGVNADHCVLGTMMDANFKGYDTILLEDCTATTSPDYCFKATLHNVRFCFGFTVTSQDLLAGLAGA